MRGDRSTRGDWLSPEAYDALSAAEKRAIWLEREKQPRPRRSSVRRGRPGDRSWLGFGVLAVAIAGVAAWELSRSSLFSRPLTSAAGTGEVRATFTFCHTGGGTNCVVDGDTIWLKGQKIRVADIDAPETHDSKCPEEQALGTKATERLQALVNSGAITLGSVDRDEDRYGRKLRLVYVDGKSVGDTLVREGLARYYRGGRRPWC